MPTTADGTYRKTVTCNFTPPTEHTFGGVEIRTSEDNGSTWVTRASGRSSPIIFEMVPGIVATTYKVGAFSYDTNGRVNTYYAGVTPVQDIIIGNAAGQFDMTKAKATTYDPDIFTISGGLFKVWAMNGSLIVAGTVSTAALDTTAINVGGGGNKPGKFAVYNAAGTQIGFIGVEDAYSGAWFKTLGIGGSSKAAPKITADSSGNVSVTDAAITVNGSYVPFRGGSPVATIITLSPAASIPVTVEDSLYDAQIHPDAIGSYVKATGAYAVLKVSDGHPALEQYDENGNLLDVTISAQGFLEVNSGIAKGQWAGLKIGNIAIQALTTPGTPGVGGSGGSTTYGYKVTALLADGVSETEASVEGITTSGHVPLNSTYYNTVSWTAVPGATYYNVYRTTGPATTGKITASPITATTFHDTGMAASGAAPTVNSTGAVSGGKIVIRESDAPDLMNELVFKYDSGDGKMKLRIFDGANTFVFESV